MRFDFELDLDSDFDLEIYTTSRQEKNLETLLNLIQEIVDKHSDTEVLEACAKTLEVLCDDKFAIYSRCDLARSKLCDIITNRYKESADDFMNLLNGGEEPNEDEVFGLKLGEHLDASQFALLEHVGFNFITELLL